MQARTCSRGDSRGFTLIELLVVVSIIALLSGILLPLLSRAEGAARDIQCAGQLKQIATANANYLIAAREVMFWRDADIDNYGMEWYATGGRDDGSCTNTSQLIFNGLRPRPLNYYVGRDIRVFHCPE